VIVAGFYSHTRELDFVRARKHSNIKQMTVQSTERVHGLGVRARKHIRKEKASFYLPCRQEGKSRAKGASTWHSKVATASVKQ